MRNSLVIFIMMVLSACEAPQMPLPGVTGRAGELVVVMPDAYWKSAVGDTVFAGLAQHVYGLPQPEPMFNVVHIQNSAFTKIFQTHRNVLLVHIGAEYKQKRIDLKTDVWASPQIVVEISAPDAESFVQVFTENQQRIIDHVIQKEQERILKSYNAQLNDDVIAHLSDTHSVKLSIPKGYNLARSEKGFSWIRYQTKDVTQSILVYSEPYKRPDTFTKEGMIKVMDHFSRRYVGGPDPGSYMKTVTEYPPLFKETALAGDYATSLKGLWDLEGALMGGPFVCYATLNKNKDRVIYLHGFVFAPAKDKRNYLRQVEAMINSLELL